MYSTCIPSTGDKYTSSLSLSYIHILLNTTTGYKYIAFLISYVASTIYMGDFPDGSEGKVSICNAGDPGSIPGSGRSPGEGNGNPLQYYCLENPMDGGAW